MSASKKLIDTINDAILTGTNGNSSINEQSFLSHLLTNRSDRTFFSEKPKQGEKWTSFLMTRWILRFIRWTVMVAIWAIHVVWYLIVPKNKSRICTTWKAIWSWLKNVKNTKGWQKRWTKVKSIDMQRVRCLLDVQSSPVINFSVIAAVFIFSISFIVKTVTFAIKDYMFPPLNMRANEQGVLTIDQPYLESHSFFLLNASTFWWPTGININKGDKVTFSVSGSMYSDIGEMYRAARDNKKLLYPRARFVPNKNSHDNEGVNYCIYNRLTNCSRIQSKDAWFGTLLCQVSDEHLPPLNSSRQQQKAIVQITSKTNSFKAKKEGMLFLTFNDVLLTRETVNNLLEDQYVDAKTMQKDLRDSKFFDTAQPDSTIWFKDNAGEYLVNIRVERNIRKSNLSCSKKIANSILREFEHWQRRGFLKSKVPIMLGIIIIYFLIDIIVSYRVRSRQADNNTPLEN